MIASIQITNTEIFAFIPVLVFKLLSEQVLLRKIIETVKNRLLFKKIANFTGNLLRNYKQLECKIIRILLKHVHDHLSVFFQFA